MGEVIALLSGTGGMGKSSLTAGLAIALAKSGKKVLCVDCQAGFGTLDIYLGLESQDALSYADICRGDYPLSRAAVHPQLPKLSFLSAPVRPENVEDTFGGMISRAKADHSLLAVPAVCRLDGSEVGELKIHRVCGVGGSSYRLCYDILSVGEIDGLMRVAQYELLQSV